MQRQLATIGAVLAVSAALLVLQLPATAGYITYTNGSVLNIEELWPPNRGRCCYDMPPDAVVSMDSHYGIYTEFGCPLGKRTCKWSTPGNDVIIKSIWVCDCPAFGHPWENSTVTGTCCTNSRVGATPAVGKTNPTEADGCSPFDTTSILEYNYYGTPSNLTCIYNTTLGIVTGLYTTWQRRNSSRSAEFGGAGGDNVTSLLLAPGQFVTTLGVTSDPVTGYIAGIRAVVDRGASSWTCGSVNSSSEVVYSGYSALRPVNANLTLAETQAKYREYVGAFSGSTCVLEGRPVLGRLAAVWGRDMTYYSFPGYLDGVPYVDPDTIAVPVNDTGSAAESGTAGAANGNSTGNSTESGTAGAATNASKEHTAQHVRLTVAAAVLGLAAGVILY